MACDCYPIEGILLLRALLGDSKLYGEPMLRDSGEFV